LQLNFSGIKNKDFGKNIIKGTSTIYSENYCNGLFTNLNYGGIVHYREPDKTSLVITSPDKTSPCKTSPRLLNFIFNYKYMSFKKFKILVYVCLLKFCYGPIYQFIKMKDMFKRHV
jgi:hypothetical protein